MKRLDFDGVHRFVEAAGPNTFWDGWSVVMWRENRNGVTSPKGMYRNGKWGIATRVNVDSNGVWSIPNGNSRSV